MQDDILNTAAGKQWATVGTQPHHGIAIPLFSLHSKKSCGIGEYLDLLPMIQWCKERGLSVIQLNPINDTGNDASPYNGISAFALNPIFITLSSLPYYEGRNEFENLISQLKELSASQRIQYKKVRELKERFLQMYFENFYSKYLTNDYKEFVVNNGWLKGYALFKILREERASKSWLEWEESLKNIDDQTLKSLYQKYENQINFHIFVQYLCYSQMRQVKEFAQKQGVFIKGDIPILINRDSADVWLHRRFFIMEFSAGAPPDMLGPEGQYWGFPIYNWEAIEFEDYSWWRTRLNVHTNYFHIYRLDHMVGFYRIWAIPVGKPSREGQFYLSDPQKWIPQGEKILKVMLETSPMLPIAEDLGTVPPEVRVHMRKLGICGTRVMRWERFWHELGQPFIPYDQYISPSMTTVSTHDSETVQLWWRNHPNEAKDFCRFKNWDYRPELSLERHKEILRDSHHTNSLFHINLLNEYLFFVPGATWPNLEDERINVPGTVNEKNWTYRFKPSVEEIVENVDLKRLFADLL